MQFIFDHGLYKIVRITGPQHNFLAIRLSDKKCAKKIVALPIKSDESPKINSNDVKDQVESGLSAVNYELGKEYFVSEIQFIPTDTYSSSVYQFLVQELIKHIDTNGKFKII